MPAAHSRPPPLFRKQTRPMQPRPPGIGPTAAKSLAASHLQKPEASARNTCRLASRNGPYGNAKTAVLPANTTSEGATPRCKHCPARRHCRRAVAPGQPYPQKATWPKTPAATRPGRQRPFNRQTSMQDTTAMAGTPCQCHGTGMAKNHRIVANSPWLHGRKGCTMAKNGLQEFRFSVGRKWKTPLIFNHLHILRL